MTRSILRMSACLSVMAIAGCESVDRDGTTGNEQNITAGPECGKKNDGSKFFCAAGEECVSGINPDEGLCLPAGSGKGPECGKKNDGSQFFCAAGEECVNAVQTLCMPAPRPCASARCASGTVCEDSAGQAKCVSLLEGRWGADDADMTVQEGKARIRFGCAEASIDAFNFQNATDFTATGTRVAGSGMQPLPGNEPKPQPATFVGKLSGTALTLDMIVGENSSSMKFTKDRQVHLNMCL